MASITWLRNVSGSVMTMYTESSKLEDGRDFEITTNQIPSNRIFSTFSITSTLATDSGNYTCRASNRLGTADSTQSMVSVFGMFLLCMYNLAVILLHGETNITDLLTFFTRVLLTLVTNSLPRSLPPASYVPFFFLPIYIYIYIL